jgi:hypothetical protein
MSQHRKLFVHFTRNKQGVEQHQRKIQCQIALIHHFDSRSTLEARRRHGN